MGRRDRIHVGRATEGLAGLKRPRSRCHHGAPSRSLASSLPSPIETDAALSRDWHLLYSSIQGEGTFFVDPDFPPCSASIDGRRRRPRREEKGSEEEAAGERDGSIGKARAAAAAVLCKCGLPASARTVQSDGPSYGRFYLACGSGSRRAAQRRLISARDGSVDAPAKPCNFFQWDPHGALGAANQDGSGGGGYSSSLHDLEWVRFDPRAHDCRMVVPQSGPDPSHVRQGRVGNCWFLSALAVVAERPHLISRVLPHSALNDRGVYQLNFCLDGRWTPVFVDSCLPVVVERLSGPSGTTAASAVGGSKAGRRRQISDGILLPNQRIAFGAFCATASRQLWPALVEKAYAKAHGCYRNLTGGFVAEGLHDLTGAPTETIVLSATADAADPDAAADELWVRLVSFCEAGFVMGLATAFGGGGLVGGHAYSVLDVVEVHNSVVGEQCKLTDYFTVKSNKPTTSSELSASTGDLKSTLYPSSPAKCARGDRTTVRLVRIRNPWGAKEWKGDWSVESERWTMALRKKLKGSWNKGDGTFFMSFEDVLQRFHHLDVAKTREGWVFESLGALFRQTLAGGVESSNSIFLLTPDVRTWAFLSIIQPKKRANTNTSYYYCDPSFVLLKRRDGDEEWLCETAVFCGIKRSITCEVFLDPSCTYACIPFSSLTSASDPFPFRLACYSASKVGIKRHPHVQEFSRVFLGSLHKELLRTERKLVLLVAESCLLIAVHGDGCLYFVAVNGRIDSFLLLYLKVEETDGAIMLVGQADDTHTIAPRSQQVLGLVSRSGKVTATSELKFRYICDTMPNRVQRNAESAGREGERMPGGNGLCSSFPITVAGDLLASNKHMSHIAERGSHTMDIFTWIPQLGSAR